MTFTNAEIMKNKLYMQIRKVIYIAMWLPERYFAVSGVLCVVARTLLCGCEVVELLFGC